MIKRGVVYWNDQLELAKMKGERDYQEVLVEAIETVKDTEISLLNATAEQKLWACYVIDTKRNVQTVGDFPDGVLNRSDEGSLLLNVIAVKGRVVINFGEQLSWIGMRPKEARELIRAIEAKSEEAEVTSQN